MKLILLIGLVIDLIVILINIGTYHKYKAPDYKGIIMWLVSGFIIGGIVCLIASSGYLFKTSGKYIEEELYLVESETYVRGYLLLDTGTYSTIEDVEGHTHSFPTESTPIIYGDDAPYLIEYRLNDFAREWLIPIKKTYELHLIKEEE